MIWPPSIMRVRVARNGRRRFRLWLPLILFWPPALALMVLLLPLVLIAALVLCRPGKALSVLLAGPVVFLLFCRLRGLLVDIKGPGERVFVSFH